MGISLLAALLLFSGCGKELDELPIEGSDTESPENPEQTEGELLRLRVSDAGYLDAGTGSRATDSGLTTTFEDDDKIGLFVVNNENEVLYANVPYTKSGADWTAAQDIRTKGYPVRVFAYYPYVEDDKIIGKINNEAQDASAFFQKYIEGLDISNQSTLADYRQADVMACMVSIDGAEAARKELTLKMNHLMGLVVVKLPTEVTFSSVTYYLKDDENYEWTIPDVTLPANLSGESFTVSGIQPLKEETGYRYLCKSGDNNISFSGGFKTYGATKSYTVSDATISAGSSKTYNVSVTPFAFTDKIEYTPKVGDFYMKDGSILPDVSDNNKNDCVGIVFYVGNPNVAEKTHGLIISLDEQTTRWGDSNAGSQIIGTKGFPESGFLGYDDTKILLKYPDYGITKTFLNLKESILASLPNRTCDWYIPSVDEMLELYKVKDLLNIALSSLEDLDIAIISDAYYWTSCEYVSKGSLYVYVIDLTNKALYYGEKYRYSYRVRLISAF